MARAKVNEKARMELMRVGSTLTIMRWIGPMVPAVVESQHIPF
jgi:hypothetical protein